MTYLLAITHLQHIEYVPLLAESECDLKAEIAALFTARCHEPVVRFDTAPDGLLEGTVEPQTGVYIEGLGQGVFRVVAADELRRAAEHAAHMEVAFGPAWRTVLDEEANSWQERRDTVVQPAPRKLTIGA